MTFAAIYLPTGDGLKAVYFDEYEAKRILDSNGYAVTQANNAWRTITDGGSAILDCGVSMTRAL